MAVLRRRPLTPLFDPDAKRGSVDVGITPGYFPLPSGAHVTVTPGALSIDLAVALTGASVGISPGTIAIDQAIPVVGASVSVTPGTPMIPTD